MTELYQKPRNLDRFDDYLNKLHGNGKKDLLIPLGGFNPMAKEHVYKKLEELKSIGAEEIMQQTLIGINEAVAGYSNPTVFKVSLTLSDDVGGAWTNRYTADYDGKFSINALVKRNFCTPVFWSGEDYDARLVEERTQEYVFRTIYNLDHPEKPVSLKDHVDQELFVAKRVNYTRPPVGIDYIALDSFNRQHADSDDYHVIFNFLYGDAASEDLGFTPYGIDGYLPGFAYCRMMAKVI